MKKYGVNVHYNAVISVEVEAECEDEALELAEIKANCELLTNADIVGVQKCITFEEEIK